jgi:hypothetical protein
MHALAIRLALPIGLALATGLGLTLIAACRGPDAGAGAPLPESLPPGAYAPRERPPLQLDDAQRPDLLQRARVRHTHAVPIERVDLSAEPGDDPIGSFVACRFQPSEPSGTSSKFECVTPDGEVLKVKYGGALEIHAEVAGTRLLGALGFGADHVALVRTLRCFGCPREPYYVAKVLDRIGLTKQHARGLDYGSYVDFDWVSAERKHPGRTVVAGRPGFGLYELTAADEDRGGATRAEVDALHLAAMFLAHWDNKDVNQRLVCLDEAPGDASGCAVPFAVVQDVGATFGPNRVALDKWRSTPIWADPQGCRLTMTKLPYAGTTFHDLTISEAGRSLLADQLRRLSRRQIEGLFEGARFAKVAPLYRPRSVSEWADVFEAKVREIRDRDCGS